MKRDTLVHIVWPVTPQVYYTSSGLVKSMGFLMLLKKYADRTCLHAFTPCTTLMNSNMIVDHIWPVTPQIQENRYMYHIWPVTPQIHEIQ